MSTIETEVGGGTAPAEARDGSRDDFRERVVEAARDIVSEEGLDALSMRALALRVGCSPAAIYLHFHDKDELLRSVMEEGFTRLGATVREELSRLEGEPTALEQLGATGRAYARFALDNTGYFRAMFKLPRVPHLASCPAPSAAGPLTEDGAVQLLQRAQAEGSVGDRDVGRAAVLGWGLMHGLTSLYLSGHLSEHVSSHEEFMELIDSAIDALREGWKA
jgi:AcrR family transcriptional regulator